MEYLELARRQNAFTCLAGHIEKEEEVPRQCAANMELAQDVLGEATRGLESMTSGLEFYPVEDLRGIVEELGFRSSRYTAKTIKHITSEVKDILKDLMRLEESPREVYADEERKQKVLNACKQMSSYYNRRMPNYRVLDGRPIPKFDRF